MPLCNGQKKRKFQKKTKIVYVSILPAKMAGKLEHPRNENATFAETLITPPIHVTRTFELFLNHQFLAAVDSGTSSHVVKESVLSNPIDHSRATVSSVVLSLDCTVIFN